MSPLRDIDGLAELLNVPPGWIREKIAARSIPFTRLGKHIRFTEQQIEQIIAEGEQPALTSPPKLSVVWGNHPPAGPVTPRPPAGPKERSA